MTIPAQVLERIERTYDMIPRRAGARVEQLGPFDLFLAVGAGHSYYARPRLGAPPVTAADVSAVRARQRELGAPESVEWVRDVTPEVGEAVAAAGLTVTLAPLMVLDPARLPDPASVISGDLPANLALLDPDEAEFADRYALSRAVAAVAFGAGGTAVGPAGTAARDAACTVLGADRLAAITDRIRHGSLIEAVASTGGDEVVARGGAQSAEVDGWRATEVVGVATLPAARRQGLGAAVTALLAATALAAGSELVFLSAATEEVARIYERVGFRRIGTAGIAEA